MIAIITQRLVIRRRSVGWSVSRPRVENGGWHDCYNPEDKFIFKKKIAVQAGNALPVCAPIPRSSRSKNAPPTHAPFSQPCSLTQHSITFPPNKSVLSASPRLRANAQAKPIPPPPRPNQPCAPTCSIVTPPTSRPPRRHRVKHTRNRCFLYQFACCAHSQVALSASPIPLCRRTAVAQ